MSHKTTGPFTAFVCVFTLGVSWGGGGLTGLDPLTQCHPRVRRILAASSPQVLAENEVSGVLFAFLHNLLFPLELIIASPRLVYSVSVHVSTHPYILLQRGGPALSLGDPLPKSLLSLTSPWSPACPLCPRLLVLGRRGGRAQLPAGPAPSRLLARPGLSIPGSRALSALLEGEHLPSPERVHGKWRAFAWLFLLDSQLLVSVAGTTAGRG